MFSRRLSILAAVTAFLLLVSTASVRPAVAQSCEEGSPAAYLDLQISNQPIWCQLPFNPGVIFIDVVARSIPFHRVRFSLPDPPLGVVLDETWYGATTGDRASGMEVDMGGCAGPGDIPVGRLTVLVTAGETAPCSFWNVATGCEVQDCTGDWRPALAVDHEVGSTTCASCCFQCCYYALAPYNPYPANGATSVPLNVVLSWDGTPEEAIDMQYGGCSLYISTSPDCSSGDTYSVPCDVDAFAPNFLQPHTTYYWQAYWGTAPSGCTDLNSGWSPLYSFTTEGPVATETRTWGNVKAIYR